MPIKIYKLGEEPTGIAWLCNDEWALPPQIAELERWVQARQEKEPVECAADIGFKWRREAAADGVSLDAATLKKMGDLGITLFLSEYPEFVGEEDVETA